MPLFAEKPFEAIRDLLKIKFKSRIDTFTDQYNRIFMVKITVICSMVLGLNWFNDTLTCTIPSTSEMDKVYVNQACWIQGFYIFKQLSEVNGDLRYYGLPNSLKDDGIRADGSLCEVAEDKNCTPMEKTFYLQYQWFPFYVAAIGFLFYLPYIFFRYINTDLISLKLTIKTVEVDIDSIIKNYFNYQISSPLRMRLRILANIGVKISYVLVNAIAFHVTDILLNGDFRRYGFEWIAWTKERNEEAYDYTESRQRLKPGEMLLPTFGICNVLELGKDIKHTLFNEHKFVCEISQNVLYHYVLALLWFLFVSGMLVSCVGLIIQIVEHGLTKACFLIQGDQARKIYQFLMLRECEYLEYIRKKKRAVYDKVIRKLKEERLGYEPVSNNPDQPSNQNHQTQDEVTNV